MRRIASFYPDQNKIAMQNTKNNTTTKNYTLTLTKEIGKLWILKDIHPFRKNFELFFDQDLGHDIGRVMTCGCTNHVLDILAGEEKRIEIDFRTAKERMDLPGYVEFELVKPCSLAAEYLVNNCPGRPQMQAWVNASVRQIFREYPAFAYIKKKA